MAETTFNGLLERIRDHTPGLFPTGVWDKALDSDIAGFDLSEIGDSADVFDLSYGLSVKSGLHLWNESLELSHSLSQDIHHATGSYWHGVMHRMEGDYGNAKYWFDRVGRHEVFERLRSVKQAVIYEGDIEHAGSAELRRGLKQFYLQPSWDPYLFIDLVQGVVTSGREPGAEHLLKNLQKLEIITLLEHSYRHAFGGQRLEPNP